VALEPVQAEAFALQVERFYASLISAAESSLIGDTGLGGNLFYAGELCDPASTQPCAQTRALLVAANIAGAATLVASADSPVCKQALRDGAVDFLVTTLDESLRILKNEVRKRQTVAVCVAQEPERVEREMQKRGLQPDLLSPIEPAILQESQAILLWHIHAAPALWLPKIDAIVQDCLQQNRENFDSKSWEGMRRWLRLSPRYLGRMAQGVRLLRCAAVSADALQKRLQEAADSGVIGVPVEVRHIQRGCAGHPIFAPAVN
jgi:urocanate hydratase